MACPKCGAVEVPKRRAGEQYAGISVLDRADDRNDDLMICLHCGCQFYRRGERLHPHGIEYGREDVLFREER